MNNDIRVKRQGMKNLKAVFITAGFLLVFLTAQSAINTQAQQSITPATLGSPRTTLLTTFDNGTSKVIWVNGTATQFLDGMCLL
ncbi:MAG: hypothetical protein ACRD4J_09055 [Nitrososphaeraceae archaeon]